MRESGRRSLGAPRESGVFQERGRLPYSASDTAFLPSSAGTSFASYFNVDPGTYTLTTTDTMADCEPVLTPFAPYGFPLPSAPHSVQVVVLKGYLSELASTCTPLPKIVPVDGG